MTVEVDSAINNVAAGNPERKARLFADWHQAVAALETADQGAAILSTPPNETGTTTIAEPIRELAR